MLKFFIPLSVICMKYVKAFRLCSLVKKVKMCACVCLRFKKAVDVAF